MTAKLKELLKQRWKNYRFRFVPWVALNIHNRLKESARIVPSSCSDAVVPKDEILRQLMEVLPFFIRPTRHLNAKYVSDSNKNLMVSKMGFVIDRAPSLLPGGGTGVFVMEGVAKKGRLVALYPGTVYQPYEPLLLPSISNPFVFRCIDGVHVDGKDCGLSRIIFKSCTGRDKVGPLEVADMTWLTQLPANPLSVGQYVNNQTNDVPCNVAYQELDLPESFDLHLRPLLPYVNYGGFRGLPSRVVALVATTDIPRGTEVLSSYLTLVGS